jgi:hypothetical protein
MSYWSDLEAELNPVFAETFGQDPVNYDDGSHPPYPVVFVLGDPSHEEGVEPAFCHLWAPASSFRRDPAPGDKIVTPSGQRFTVFGVHRQTSDGDMTGASFWISVNQL